MGRVMDVPFLPLKRQYEQHKNEYDAALLSVMESGQYILGERTAAFEKEFGEYIGGMCVGVSSGLSALEIAFRALNIGEGDEVIVAANAYIACVMGITRAGATPVLVEPNAYFNIDVREARKAVTDKTRAILAVHLYGQPCDMTGLKQLCAEYGIYLVEDCAQSHGATFNGKQTGSFGDVSCFSFYPTKNLGGFGDGGAIVTDERTAQWIRTYRNYGSEKKYYNSMIGDNARLDELQSALLSVKLKYLKEINNGKEHIAKRYLDGIKNGKITLPRVFGNVLSVWHQFVVLTDDRDGLAEYMKARGIDTAVHYPIPPHKSGAYSYLGGSYPITERYAKTCLSLPCFCHTDDEIDYVIDMINGY